MDKPPPVQADEIKEYLSLIRMFTGTKATA